MWAILAQTLLFFLTDTIIESVSIDGYGFATIFYFSGIKTKVSVSMSHTNFVKYLLDVGPTPKIEDYQNFFR